MEEKDTGNDVQALRDDMAALREDFAKITEDIKTMGSEKAGSAREDLGETVQNFREELRKIIDETGTRGRKSLETMEGEIGDRPLTSVLISFGAGLLLAKLLERK